MPSKESLPVVDSNEIKEQPQPVVLERVWNWVNYKTEFVKKSPTKLLLTLTNWKQTQQFEISNIKKPEDLFKALRQAFEYMFPNETFPQIDHPIFSQKIKQTFANLYPLESANISSSKKEPESVSPPVDKIDWKAWEEESETLDNEEIKLDIKWHKNKYIIEWQNEDKPQRISLLWRESKFGKESYITIYHKNKWSLRGHRERVLLTQDFDSFWYNFKQTLGQRELSVSDDFKEEFKRELWENILKAKLKDTSINLKEAQIAFQRGETSYVVRIQNEKDKALIFVNNRKVGDINFSEWINGFAIELWKILDENVWIPRQNVREVVLAIWDSWKLKNIAYNPEFVIKHSFGDPAVFDDLKKLFVLKDEDLQEFKKNFLKFRQSIEKNESHLEEAFKGVIEYLYSVYAGKFKLKNIELDDLMENWPLIYHNLKITLYYFAHLESDFKNVRKNPKSSAKWYFQILTDDGRWKEWKWAPSSFQVAVNRLYQVMTFLKDADIQAYDSIKSLIGGKTYETLMNTSRAAPFPPNINNQLLKMPPEGQGTLAFVNFLIKVASKDFDMLLNILRWKPEAILDSYLLYHHTNADAQTLARAKDLSAFYFPFLKEFDFR